MIKKTVLCLVLLTVTAAAKSEAAGIGTRPADGCRWTATGVMGVDAVTLTVKGVCQEPTPGYKLALTRVNVPGSDPATLSLALMTVAPTGIEPQHVTPTSVEYRQTFIAPRDHAPSRVVIFEQAATVQVTRVRPGV